MKLKVFSLRNERISAYIQIVVGCVLGAMAYPLFLVPNAIAPGGLTGIATILHALFGTPVGTVSLLMNIPLFLIGYRAMGKVFAFRSLVATILFSLLIDWLPMPVATTDTLLGSLFGGILMGFGLGLILRGGATTGGSDMVARMVHMRFQHISVGAFLFFIDFCVVLAAGFFIRVESALYAFISIYAGSRVVDLVVQGVDRQKACYIITAQTEVVKNKLMAELGRGLTILSAHGGFRGEERPVLLCIVSAQEVSRLKTIVRMEDERAFVFITDAYEVLGEGFRDLKEVV
ncbi:MAG TPA: YitT family protein [Candidatus Limiplasma sp.]|nr:YitT family protein [Candidatus Limiplasma sp.]